MTFTRKLLLGTGMVMALSHTYAQSLFSPRAMALGNNGAAVRDTRGFENNPAGLTGLRDWEFMMSTYTATGNSAGFVFHGITFGKRFLETEAVALQFSPGALLEFIVPSQFVSTDSTDPNIIDRTFSYSENFTLGYAHKFSDQFALGAMVRLWQEKISDKVYSFIANNVPVIRDSSYSEHVVLLDPAFQWRPLAGLSIAAVGRNFLSVKKEKFPAEQSQFALPAKRSLELSVRYEAAQQVALMGSGSTNASGSLGYELNFPIWNVGLHNSLYFDKSESPFAYALSVGLGWSYQFLEIDASYLRFFNQAGHSGAGNFSSFDGKTIHSIALNRFTLDRIAFSVKAIFGNVRESLARIEGVEITSAVYPSSYELFAFRPIGKMRVRNISEKPIQAKVSFYIEKYMDAPTESPAVHMLPGEVKEIPFNAVLNEQIKSVNKLTIREGNVFVNTTPAEEYDDKFQTKVLIHGRNDWDGDANALRNFVTPEDPDILRYTRDVLLEYRDSISNVPRELEQVVKARLLFNSFAGKLVYVGDPKQSSDYVQYPSETLVMKSGDCDDMTTAFASLLSSVGISTAFIDVVPPQAPEKSHIYLMFDTGLEPKFGSRISENPKRYFIRKNPKGIETIWLPIESTVIAKGFDEAWSVGAEELFNDTEINLGLIKGWVKIVDIN
jgi:hypothetical protein